MPDQFSQNHKECRICDRLKGHQFSAVLFFGVESEKLGYKERRTRSGVIGDTVMFVVVMFPPYCCD